MELVEDILSDIVCIGTATFMFIWIKNVFRGNREDN